MKDRKTEKAQNIADDRLCPIYDETGIRMYPVAKPEEMGMRVLDNCAEEHIM